MANHKIVEHAIGAGRWCSCRCSCGWKAEASSLERLDDLTELHLQQFDGCNCEPKGQAFHQRNCEQFDGSGGG